MMKIYENTWTKAHFVEKHLKQLKQ